MLLSEFLEEHAEELGVAERNMKTQILALIWSFMFGFTPNKSQTLAGLRRSYNITADDTLPPGGFQQWLIPVFAEYLSDLVRYGANRDATLRRGPLSGQ